jgi:hypothetical protein
MAGCGDDRSCNTVLGKIEGPVDHDIRICRGVPFARDGADEEFCDPAGYREIGRGANPSLESYAAYFNRLDAKTPDSLGWTKVIRPADLEPGDICLWLKPVTLDTGHMWIIAGTPSVNPKRTDEVLVRIFDSSSAHSDDSRTVSVYKTGLGSGILGMMVDGKGSPIGLYWDGGVSTSAGEKDTTIICGRLNRLDGMVLGK